MKTYEQLFSKLPYNNGYTQLVRELNKLAKRSRSKWRIRLRYRSSEFVDARKAKAKYVSVYLRFSQEYINELRTKKAYIS